MKSSHIQEEVLLSSYGLRWTPPGPCLGTGMVLPAGVFLPLRPSGGAGRRASRALLNPSTTTPFWLHSLQCHRAAQVGKPQLTVTLPGPLQVWGSPRGSSHTLEQLLRPEAPGAGLCGPTTPLLSGAEWAWKKGGRTRSQRTGGRGKVKSL